MKMTEGVANFLKQIGMGMYFEVFSARGFDLESDIPHLTMEDLEHSLMISSHRHREIILRRARHHMPGKEHEVYQWLCSNFLEHYFIGFVQSELTDLQTIAKLQLPNDDLYDELEIVLPGHRKRLERAVKRLQQQMPDSAEKPVTQGWWGKPVCLPQAKFDFLMVQAQLSNPLEPHHKVDVDFMVDSGSDVSTVQESSLKNLHLELLGSVYSCGIHGGNHTNLYKARLKIGDQEMDIEILVSNYDSLGSRVVRNFRHVISGDKHIWLKGNYKDPLPAFLPLPAPPGVASDQPKETATSTMKALPGPEQPTSITSPVSNTGTDSNTKTSCSTIHLNTNICESKTSKLHQNPSSGSESQLVLNNENEKSVKPSSQKESGGHSKLVNAHQSSTALFCQTNPQSGDTSKHQQTSSSLNPIPLACESLRQDSTHTTLHSKNMAPSKGKRKLPPDEDESVRIKFSKEWDGAVNDAGLEVESVTSESSIYSDHNINISNRSMSNSLSFSSSASHPSSSYPDVSVGVQNLSSCSKNDIRNDKNDAYTEQENKSYDLQERVSLKQIISSHLRDTDDDIDYLNNGVKSPSHQHLQHNKSFSNITTSQEVHSCHTLNDDIVHISCILDDEGEEENIDDKLDEGFKAQSPVPTNHDNIIFLTPEDLEQP